MQVGQSRQAQPRVLVGEAVAGGGDGLEDGGAGFEVGREAGEGQCVGDAAHQLGVADAAQRAVVPRLFGGVRLGDEGGAPQLHRVGAGRLPAGARGARQHQGAVVEEGVAVGGQRGDDLLADEVVGQQQGAAVVGGTEDVQQVLAVGRTDQGVEREPGGAVVGVEGPRGGAGGRGGQVVAAGEDQPLVVGQDAAVAADAVEPDDLPGAGVVHEVARRPLVVGQDAQEQQRADAGVVDGRVGERLEGVVHGLAVDAVGGGGVVLGLDGEEAADGGDVQGAEDVDVRVPARHVVLAGGRGPGEGPGDGRQVVAFALGVEVFGVPLGVQPPAQDADVGGPLAGAEDGEQERADGAQPDQAGLLEVAVQLVEVALERGVGQQARHRVGRCREEGPAAAAVKGEGVAAGRVVVPGQQQPADVGQVGGYGRAFGAEPFGGDEFEFEAAERPDAALVEVLGAAGEVVGRGQHAVAQHLVAAAVPARSGHAVRAVPAVRSRRAVRRLGRSGRVGRVGHVACSPQLVTDW